MFLTYRRALDSQGLHTLGVTDIALLLPSRGEAAPHTFCRVDKNLNTGMVSPPRARLLWVHLSRVVVASCPAHSCLFLPQWGPALYVCYKRAVAKANALVYKASEYPPHPPTPATATL